MSAAEDAYVEDAPPASLNRKNPFKFLEYYEETDAAIFAGRAEELTNVLAYFALGPTYVLYGRSGLGKTSILRAGLFPKLTAIGYLPIYVRILDNPEIELCEAVAEKLGIRSVTPDELPELLGNVPPREGTDAAVTPVVLALDQFEEFFIRFRNEEGLRKRKRFAELLGRISREGGAAVRILFSLREDRIAELEDLRPQLPDILNRSHRLLPLTAVGTREAILLTLDYNVVAYDIAVPGDIVKILEKRFFNPLELQIYCSEIFEAARTRARKQNLGSIRIERDDVKEVGSIEQVYEKYLDGVIRDLNDNARALLACCVLDVLRTAEQTKRALRVSDIAVDGTADPDFSISFKVGCDDAATMLEYLCGKQVVRQLPTKEKWYELLHDGIVPVLTDWLQRHENFRSFRDADRLIENLRTIGEHLTERQIRLRVEPYRDLLRLTTEKKEFLLRSSVFEGAESVDYWAKRYDEEHGDGAANAIVLQAIASADQTIAGLHAAGRIAAPAFALACFEKAISDRKRDVRRAAGTAYAQIGHVDFDALKSALRRPRTRRRAIELLADLQMRDLDISRINRLTRWRVNRLVEKRRLDRGAELIRNRATVGLLGGLAGAIFWMAFAVPAIYLLMSIFTPSMPILSAFDLLLLGIPVLLFAIWNGRRVVERVARESVLEQRECWSNRALSPVELEVLWLVIAWAFTFALKNALLPPGDASRWFAELLISLVLATGAVVAVRKAWRTFAERRKPPHRQAVRHAVLFVIALIVSAVSFVFKVDGPIIAIGAVLLVRSLLGPATRLVQRTLDLPSAGFAAMLMRSAQVGYLIGASLFVIESVSTRSADLASRHVVRDVVATAVIAAFILVIRVPLNAFVLAWAQKLYPLAAEDISAKEQETSRAARIALNAAIPATIVILGYLFGTDCLPLLSRFHTYAPGEPIVRTFAKSMGTHYVRIAPRNDGLVVGSFVSKGTLVPTILVDRQKLEGRFAATRGTPLPIAITTAVDGSEGYEKDGRAEVVFVAEPLDKFIGIHLKDNPAKGEVLTRLPARCNSSNLVTLTGTLPKELTANDRLVVMPHAVIAKDLLFPIKMISGETRIAAMPSAASIHKFGYQVDAKVSGSGWSAGTLDFETGNLTCRRVDRSDVAVLATLQIVKKEKKDE